MRGVNAVTYGGWHEHDESDKQEPSRFSPRLVAEGGGHETQVAGRRARQRVEIVSSTNESL